MQETKFIPLLFCLLCGIAGSVHAQNVRTASLTWHSEQSIELRNNTPLIQSFELTTSSSTITITQGAVTKTFSIQSIEGQWTDADDDGQLVYQLGFGSKTGSGTIQRADGEWSFILDFSTHQDGIRQKFILSAYQLN